jgi:opacity protein-like surface antigen
MKRVMVISIVWLTGCSLIAQPTAGKLFLGGNLKTYTSVEKTKTGSTTENNGTTTYLSILPMAGYFLSEKIAFGAGIGVDASFYKLSGGSPEKSNSVTFVFNPFARYYLISGTGGLFAEAFIRTGIGSTKDFYETTTDTQKSTDFSMGVAPGVYYYITSKLALEAKFGWLGFRSEATNLGEDTKDITNTFGFQFTPDSFVFGVTYTL